ncbi:MAG: hypothetical protein Q4B68_02035 [Bacteroidales bacterium]|nr:hypothetical protein [Bacteroidales bacterium]
MILYHGSNMAIDKQFLIEELTNEIVRMLIEDYEMNIDTALNVLYTSRTFAKIEDEKTGLYYQGGVYVMDLLREEMPDMFPTKPAP